MRILTLDQALQTTAWACFDGKKLVNYGEFTIKKNLPIEARLYQIQQNLMGVINENYDGSQPDMIVFEGVQQQTNIETFHKLSMVQAAVYLLAYNLDIKTKVLSPSEWRAINSENSKLFKYGRKREEQKQVAIQKVKEWYKIDVDSDIADAINIGHAFIASGKTSKAF